MAIEIVDLPIKNVPVTTNQLLSQLPTAFSQPPLSTWRVGHGGGEKSAPWHGAKNQAQGRRGTIHRWLVDDWGTYHI